MMPRIRLNKYLASQGIASRRKCDTFISEGLIQVNGKVVQELGISVDPKKDTIQFNSKAITQEKKKYKTLMLYKPRGYVCTTASKEGKTVYSLLPSIKEKLVSIGRLDKKSEGLLLFSNDGQLVDYLTHPRHGTQKIYQVMVSGDITPSKLKKLNGRMKLDGYLTQPALVQVLREGAIPNRTLLKFTLKEGRHHQIRKMCEQVALKVHRLTRTQVKTLPLKSLKPGQWRYLTEKEVRSLLPDVSS